MARRRKCDITKAPTEPPKKECCPICSLPPDRKSIKQKGCTFFARCEKIKLEADEKASAQKRSQLFREFHADTCKVCRLPTDECKAKKISKIKSRRKRDGSSYIEDGEMTELLQGESCRPPDRSKYTPVKPEWYTA